MLVEDVVLALKMLERVEESAQEIRELRRARLEIVAPPTFVESVLSDVVAAFLRDHPDVDLTVDSRDQRTAAEMVALRSFDCGFVKSGVWTRDLDVEPLIDCGTVCVVPAESPLAGAEFLSPRELDGHRLILLGKGADFRWEVEQAFQRAAVPMGPLTETHAVGASCALAAQGVGIAIVNAILTRHYRHADVRFIPFEPDIRHKYCMVTPAGKPLSRPAELFLRYARERLAR